MRPWHTMGSRISGKLPPYTECSASVRISFGGDVRAHRRVAMGEMMTGPEWGDELKKNVQEKTGRPLQVRLPSDHDMKVTGERVCVTIELMHGVAGNNMQVNSAA